MDADSTTPPSPALAAKPIVLAVALSLGGCGPKPGDFGGECIDGRCREPLVGAAVNGRFSPKCVAPVGAMPSPGRNGADR
jgi:hypothetical protein